MTVYRLPFDDDGQWTAVPQGNWDDPATGSHQPYSFDFAHPVGGTVRAARGGEVIFVENHNGNSTKGDPVPGWGTAVLVRHIDGTVAAYDHLQHQSPVVAVGQQVLQGQVLGKSGNTGQSFGPHLHFGVCTYWNAIDDLGPDFPLQFEDKQHSAWRPFIGDALSSNNSVLRQEEWRWCSKCQGLYFSGKPSAGTVAGLCPAGDTHIHAKSGNYVVTVDSAADGQSDWRWCNKCQGMFFGGNSGSKCPAGGAHTKAGSGSYVLLRNASAASAQSGWRWCKKCQGLFFGASSGSTCPSGGAHSKDGSGMYALDLMGTGDPQPAGDGARSARGCSSATTQVPSARPVERTARSAAAATSSRTTTTRATLRARPTGGGARNAKACSSRATRDQAAPPEARTARTAAATTCW